MADQMSARMFEDEWALYRKVVDNNYLFHREACQCLHDLLVRDAPSGFRFLDIACGDAASAVTALRGTRLGAYTGIDLSEAALAIAKENARTLDCQVRFIHGEFSEALLSFREPIDVAWIGLSLHHFRSSGKLIILSRLRELLGPEGLLVIYENASPNDESRDDWLQRWDVQRPHWPALSDREWRDITSHVHEFDFPETRAEWVNLSKQAGFSSVEEVMVSPTGLFRMYVLRSAGD